MFHLVHFLSNFLKILRVYSLTSVLPKILDLTIPLTSGSHTLKNCSQHIFERKILCTLDYLTRIYFNKNYCYYGLIIFIDIKYAKTY